MKVNSSRENIVLTQMEISPFCDKVRRTLHYKGLAYSTREVKLIELSFLKRLAPTGKVPILDYGSERLWDSTDICLALEARHPAPALLPEDPRDRADALLLEDWADETLYFFEMTMRFVWPDDQGRWSRELARFDIPVVRSLAPMLVPRLTKTIVGHQGTGRKTREQILLELDRLFGALALRISKTGFCVGSALSLADISVASQIHCIQGSSQGARSVDAHPELADWKRRIDAATLP
ncbi:glutathione S-transferase family protein [Solimonas terrae]|uniref:Glutathione S-transferase family protein n=1 Tax=Solimonas terrae TaxID=1396819 RepID=A0A6M2BW34_9GAMM|nr:glutathione S-transferase family protein [Solimonas terrae]NGY06786.1 glutathione S-transferase family protein [Solimonas terrae]